YRGDHDDWFPPGYPIMSARIMPEDRQPGMPSQPGMANLFLKNYLIPDYMDKSLVCPLAQLDPAYDKAHPNFTSKEYYQAYGGTYALNGLLAQMKIESLPPDWWGQEAKKIIRSRT